MCLCCKKTKLVYDIYYCFACQRYFKSKKGGLYPLLIKSKNQQNSNVI